MTYSAFTLKTILFIVVLVSAALSQSTSEPVASDKQFRDAEILEKPRAPYTSLARQNMVEGTIRLRVQLLASGQVGTVTPLTYLPQGLTQQAVAAATNIKFRPKIVNGNPTDVVIEVSYNFNLYYENDDSDIVTKVQVTQTPKPNIERSALPASANGEILVEVFFGANGRVTAFKYLTPLDLKQKKEVDEAISKIKYRPAIHKNGKKMSVTKVVRYQL